MLLKDQRIKLIILETKTKMSKVVKNIYTRILYQKWTEVSDFLACGLVGVMVKDKSELTEEELKELKKNKDE